MSYKPLLFVDIDGVISLFGFASNKRPDGIWRLVDGVAHLLSVDAARSLRDLDALFDCVWCSGWEEKANDELPHALGLGPWPYLPLDRVADTRPGTSVRAHWKLDAVVDYAQDRPLAWIDDAFNDAVHSWAAERAAPTLLIPTDPPVGLTAEQTETLRAFATG